MQEPLPDWADRLSDGDVMVPMTQLCTKDGRRTGNAIVLHTEISHGYEVAVIQTDAGHVFKMTRAEILEAFHLPTLILKTTVAEDRFDDYRRDE